LLIICEPHQDLPGITDTLPRMGDGHLPQTLAVAVLPHYFLPRHHPSGPPGSRAAARKAVAWPPSSSHRWTGAGATVLGSTVLLASFGRPPRRCHGRIWGLHGGALIVVEGWRSDRAVAPNGEAAAPTGVERSPALGRRRGSPRWWLGDWCRGFP
jgi:hypothetical protein